VILVGCGDAATSVSPVQVLPTVTLPPELQALEHKMERLSVNSERYSRTSRVLTGAAGKHQSLATSQVGEVSLSPAVGESFIGRDTNEPSRLVIGSVSFSYSPRIARCDGGRQWVQNGAPLFIASFPYHGLSGETNSSGSGAYAGLINLLGTARGDITVVGPAKVDGRQTTEFTALVDPAMLLKGVSERELRSLTINNEDLLILQTHLSSLPTNLQVFITGSGLPVRVVTSARSGPSYAISETTEILAVNIPIKLRRPSARSTIDEADFAKLLLAKSRQCGIRTVAG
jgi:hypothetical protein